MLLVEKHNETVFVKTNLLQVVAIHLGALLVAPWYFTWAAMAFGFSMALLFAYSMGIFHHMLLTHRSFKCKKWIENTGALLGTLTWRGPFAGPIQYVAMHKIHHAHSDTELDPHTPTKGIFFALLSWFWNMPQGFTQRELYRNYAPEFENDGFMTFLDDHVHLVQLLWGLLCFTVAGAVPWLVGVLPTFDVENGVRYFVYGVFVRSLFTLYLVNAVDVVNHTIGYRAYETKDLSTNSFIMAFIHLGGAISWHNNHHAHQHYFTVKKNWWEFDAHHFFLKSLEKFGLVSDILILDETMPASLPTARVGK